MRTKNVQTEIDLTDVLAVPSKFVKRNDQFLHEGDILVSSANSWNLVGKCCWVPQLPWQTSFGGFISTLRADRTHIDPRYLFHWFSTDRTQAMLRSFGQQTTNISNLNIERTLALQCPLPPLAEQRRIAAVLDAAEALRAKRRACHAKLDSLTQSIFLEMFGDLSTNPKGWPTGRLGDEFRLQGGFAFRSDDYAQNGIRLVKISNVHKDHLTWDDTDHLPQSFSDEYESFRLDQGDIVLALTRPIIKSLDSVKVAVVRQEDLPCLLNQRVGRFLPRPESKLSHYFLLGYLQSKVFFRAVERFCSESLQPNMSTSQVEDLVIPLPPESIQKQYSFALGTIERLRPISIKAQLKLDQLFSSLQHRAFRGEL